VSKKGDLRQAEKWEGTASMSAISSGRWCESMVPMAHWCCCPPKGLETGTAERAAYRFERFMQGVEDVIGADNVAQAVAVQIGPQRRFRVYEYRLRRAPVHRSWSLLASVPTPIFVRREFSAGTAWFDLLHSGFAGCLGEN
jgi:hypothetical protein